MTRFLFLLSRLRFGRVLSPLPVLAHHPRLLRGIYAMERAHAASHRLEPRLASLAEVRVATRVGCGFCIDLGSHIALQKGLDPGQLAELDAFETSARFDERERLVLRYADAVTATPSVLPDELVRSLRARFSPPELVELTAVIAWENHRARFNHAFGLGSQGFSTCALPLAARPPRDVA